MIIGVASGIVTLTPLLTAPPTWLFLLVIFFWGMGAGVTMSMGRTIVQHAAAASHRARIMSVYSLGMMGGMPIGSLSMGYMIEWLGPTQAVWMPLIGITTIVVLVRFGSRLWWLESDA